MSKILPKPEAHQSDSDWSPPAALSPELAHMREKARNASDFLKALAHEHRLLLLCLLSERERSVTELEDLLALRQTTVSQQLARLRFDGLVTTRRKGKAIYYSVADPQTRAFMKVVYDMFCGPGSAPKP